MKGNKVPSGKDKPSLISAEDEADDFDLTEVERIDIVAKQVLEKYLPAFKELAKW